MALVELRELQAPQRNYGLEFNYKESTGPDGYELDNTSSVQFGNHQDDKIEFSTENKFSMGDQEHFYQGKYKFRPNKSSAYDSLKEVCTYTLLMALLL